MDFLDDRNHIFDGTAASVVAADSSSLAIISQGESGGPRDDGMTALQLEEFDSRNACVRTCVRCGQQKKVVDFPMWSFRKSKECKFCVVLKKRGHLCMPNDISEEFSSNAAARQEEEEEEQEQSSPEQLLRQEGGEPSSPDRSRRIISRRWSNNSSTPVLTKSLRNLFSRGDAAAMVPPLAVSTIPDAQYV